jgi:hypothetical protein
VRRPQGGAGSVACHASRMMVEPQESRFAATGAHPHAGRRGYIRETAPNSIIHRIRRRRRHAASARSADLRGVERPPVRGQHGQPFSIEPRAERRHQGSTESESESAVTSTWRSTRPVRVNCLPLRQKVDDQPVELNQDAPAARHEMCHRLIENGPGAVACFRATFTFSARTGSKRRRGIPHTAQVP